MSTRVAFIHTVGFLVDVFRREMRERLPDVDGYHILNEGLLQDLLRGAPKAQVYRRVVEQAQIAADSGAGLIVVTCSSTSPGVDIARQVIDVPILKIDDPMAAEAVRLATRIGVLCTASSTVEPSTNLLQSHAAQARKAVQLVPHVCPQAYTALHAGDRERHDALVLEAAHTLARDVDVLVLAQASLAHLRDPIAGRIACPVLASPPLLMRELVARLAPAAPGPSATQ